MSQIKSWQSGLSAFMTVGMLASGVAPIFSPTAANAQLFPTQTQTQTQTQYRVAIPAGTEIPVKYNEAQKIVITPNETVPLTLAIAANIRNRNGVILLPAGTQLVGKLQPAGSGSQFVASELVFANGRRQYISASSDVLTEKQEIKRDTNVTSILTGSAVGAGAAAAISGITGNKRITIGKVLAGVGAGALGGYLLGKKKTEVIVINPADDLNVRLNSDLALR